MRSGRGPTKNIAVLIPCHNEAEGIADVLGKFPKERLKHNGYNYTVIVIDNCSTDDTGKIAKRYGAKVIRENKKGKGNAMRAGFAAVPANTDYVIMLDGDDTYDAGEITRMVEPLQNDFCNVVIGSRLGGKMHSGAMRSFNRAGNWFFTHIVRLYYRVNVTDVLTGYFAWTKQAVDELVPHLVSEGFAIEMEMITKMARLGHDIYSVPISYTPRSGDTNLRPLYDGRRILQMFIRNMSWHPKPNNGGGELEGTA